MKFVSVALMLSLFVGCASSKTDSATETSSAAPTSQPVTPIQQSIARGVKFRAPPKTQGPFTYADFDDTCGNLIQIVKVQEDEAHPAGA